MKEISRLFNIVNTHLKSLEFLLIVYITTPCCPRHTWAKLCYRGQHRVALGQTMSIVVAATPNLYLITYLSL